MEPIKNDHKISILAIQDALEILSRKWTISIIFALAKHKKLCFKELKFHLINISAKMLSSELRELEQNMLILRKPYLGTPSKVEYELSEYGLKLEGIIFPLLAWGLDHRKKIVTSRKDICTEDYIRKIKEDLCS